MINTIYIIRGKLKSYLPLILLFIIFAIILIFIGQSAFAQDAPSTTTTLTNQTLAEWLSNGQYSDTFFNIWQAMTGLLNVIVLIGFIIFALANVFHIKYDQYEAKKVIPGLIIGIILANLSYSICLFLAQAIQYITNLFIVSPDQFFDNFSRLYAWVWALAEGGAVGGGLLGLALPGAGIGMAIVCLIVFLIPAIMIFLVGTILWIRALVIVALIGFSPIAFFLSFFPVEIPYLSGIAKKWFDYFFKALFVGPVMFFLFWLAFTINTAAQPSNTTSTTAQTQNTANTSTQTTTSGTSNQADSTPTSDANQSSGTSIQYQAIALCNTEKSKNRADWNNGPCLTSNLNNSGVAVDIAHGAYGTANRTAADNNPANQCSSKKWIELDLNCATTATSNNLSFNFYNLLAPRVVFAQTHEPTAADKTAAQGTGSTNKLALIMSIIIGVLAIVVPWGMVSELTSAVKTGAQKALGMSKQGLKYSGAEKGLKTGARIRTTQGLKWLSKSEKPMAKKTFRALQAIGRWQRGGQYAEEDYKKSKEDLAQTIDYSKVIMWMNKNGDLSKAPDHIKDLIKRLNSDAMAKAQESANQPVAATAALLGDTDAGNFWGIIKRLKSSNPEIAAQAQKDFNDFKKKDKIKDIVQHTRTLLLQANSANPEMRDQAKEELAKLRNVGGILEGELETGDLRTFSLGASLTRPSQPVAEQPENQEIIANLENVLDDPQTRIDTDNREDKTVKDVNDLAEQIEKKLFGAKFEVDKITKPITNYLEKLVVQGGRNAEQSSNETRRIIRASREALDNGNTPQAISLLQQISPTLVDQISSPDNVALTLDNAESFVEKYQSGGMTRESAESAGAELQKEIESRITNAETAHLLNRPRIRNNDGQQAHLNLNINEINELRQGRVPASLNNFSRDSQQKIVQVVQTVFRSEKIAERELPPASAPTPVPGSSVAEEEAAAPQRTRPRAFSSQTGSSTREEPPTPPAPETETPPGTPPAPAPAPAPTPPNEQEQQRQELRNRARRTRPTVPFRTPPRTGGSDISPSPGEGGNPPQPPES